ncbi:MAG: ATP-dependent zinc metalloprotease FtsH [Actinomycetota bacterium]
MIDTLRNRIRKIYQAARRWRRLRKGRRSKRYRTFLLLLSLAIVIGSMVTLIHYEDPKVQGALIRFDVLDSFIKHRTVQTATFLDEDAILTGILLCPAKPVPPPKPKASPSPTPTPSVTATPSAAPSVLLILPTDTATPIPTTPLPMCDDNAAQKSFFKFWMPYPKSDLVTGTLLTRLAESGAKVNVDRQTSKSHLKVVSTYVLPLVLLANLFALLFSAGKGGGSGIGDVIVFGSFRKRRVRKGVAARVTFGDVAGADHAVSELAEIVDYLRSPDRYRKIGAQAPKGVLMIGPPGTGKTLLAKACAGEADVPFFSVAGAEFVESLVGVGAARVRDLFRRVRAAAPAIVFIDELDAAGRRRGAGGSGGGSDEREQTLNQLLVEMDGFDASSGIVVIGATNRPDILDPALLRPGRFDRQVTIDQPDRDGRREILALHARGRRVDPNVDFELLARRTPGFSGAELANVINEAALLSIRGQKTIVGMEELLEACDRVSSGPQRRGHALTAQERTRVAAHESGHAIVAAATGRSAEIPRVSILRRGRSVGLVSAGEDAEIQTRSQLAVRITALLAGVAAEELITGEPSTGAEGDLEEATRLARDAIGRYGMSDELGRARILATAAESFLGNEIPIGDVSANTREILDDEVRALLDDSEKAARKILQANEQVLEDMIAVLEVEEHIEGSHLHEFLERVRLPISPNGRVRPKKR